MPRIRTKRSKPPPEGWELISDKLEEFQRLMREEELAPHTGKRKVETSWGIFKLNHQRTRYVYDMYYVKKEITRELWDYCVKEGYVDQSLAAKWRKVGLPFTRLEAHTLVSERLEV